MNTRMDSNHQIVIPSLQTSEWDERLVRALTPQRFRALPPVWRYALALVAVGAATALRWALIPWLGIIVPYNIWIVTAAGVTALLGLGPGLLFVLLGVVAVEVFVLGSLPSMFAAATLGRMSFTLFFVGVLICVLLHAVRIAALRARDQAERLAAFGAAMFEGIVESEAGRILDCNEQFARMLGRSVTELRGREIVEFIAPEDRERVLANIAANRESVVEHGILRKDGTLLIVEAHGQPAGPGSVRRHTAVRDITGRRQADEALKRSEEKYRDLIKYAPTGIYEVDFRIPRFTSVNDVMCQYLGYGREELLQMNPLSIMDEENASLFRERMRRQLNGEKLDDSVEYRVRAKDGREYYANLNITFTYEDGKPKGAMVIAHDVTERKRVEMRSKEVAEKYSTLFNNTSDGVWIHNLDGEILEVNDAYCRMSGYSRDELIHTPVSKLEASETPEEVAGHIKKVIETGGHDRFESRHRRKDGSIFHVDITALYFERDGGRIAIFVRDITERKRAEETVIRNQKTFVDLVERAPFGIYIVDSYFRIAHMNVGSQTGAFRNVRPVIGRDFSEAMRILWPEPVAAEIIAVFRHTLDTGEPYYSPPFVNPRHDIAIVESYEWELHRMTLPDGQYGVICYYFDSTKLRQAEAAVRRSEAMLTRAEKIGNVGSWEWDIPSGKLIWSDQTYKMMGVEAEKFIPSYDSFLVFLHPEDRPRVEQSINDATSGTRPYDLEYRIVTPDSSVRWVHARGEVAIDDRGRPNRMTGSVIDITERKRMEEALLASRNQLQSIIDNTADLVYVFDLEERFLVANRAVAELSNSSPERMIGKKRNQFMAEETAVWHEANDRKVIEAGVGLEFEEYGEFKGRAVTFLTNKFPLRDRHGRIYGVGGITVDITDRKQTEEVVRLSRDELEVRVQQRTAELADLSLQLVTAQENERKRVSYDLHDNVWQTLLAIRFNIESLFSGHEDWEALGRKSKEVTEDILGAVGKIRAMQGDLWPYVLDDIGILATIDWYCREFEKNHSGLTIESSVNVGEREVPSSAKIVIYRVMQEAMSNVAKHSQANHVSLSLLSKDHRVELTIEDNGIGFDPEETISKRAPLGGLGLLSIKARTELSGGSFGIESAKGKGMSIRASWPI